MLKDPLVKAGWGQGKHMLYWMKSKTKCWWLSYEGRPFWSTSQWIGGAIIVALEEHRFQRRSRGLIPWWFTARRLRCGVADFCLDGGAPGTRGSMAVILVKTKKFVSGALKLSCTQKGNVARDTFCYRKFLPCFTTSRDYKSIFLGVRTHCRSPNPTEK